MLADGSRFTAAEARRTEGVEMVMTEASYTPCKVCETDPHPLWQIKADKIVHNEQDKSIEYKNARLEFLDVPVVIAPIFSHADPSVKRKSGFLRPQVGWTDNTGLFAEGGYYFGDIAPDKDATFRVRPTILAGTLFQGEWRQRTENGRFQVEGGWANSDREEEDGRIESSRSRGHVFANGLFDLDEKWRAGFNAARVSDKEYLRLYDISRKDVLENEAYAERFAGRSYTRVSALNFQDVRLGDRPDQADVLPKAETRLIGEPGSLWGGRWEAGASALGLLRDGNGQDVQRGSVDIGWERRIIGHSGVVTQASLTGVGDFYAVQDRDAAALNPGIDTATRQARGLAVADVTTSYPVVKRIAKGQIVLEPVVGVSLSPQLDDKEFQIPNEDSIDIQLDTNNLFADNRFPGIDRREDGIRANYGFKAGAYGDDGRYGRVFIGQSYRFDEDTIFPEGSGLEDRSSDIVGQINVGLSKYLQSDYRFQVDNQNLSIRRHELQVSAGNDIVNVDLDYMYIDRIAGTGFDEARHQAQLGGQYHFNEKWWANASTLADMGEEPGLRRAAIGLNYADECFSFGLQGRRNLTFDASGENGTVVMMRIGFKNIGEFTTPTIQLKGAPEGDQ
jgi:LPS-assembly protein